MVIHRTISRRHLHAPYIWPSDRYVRGVFRLYCRGCLADHLINPGRCLADVGNVTHLWSATEAGSCCLPPIWDDGSWQYLWAGSTQKFGVRHLWRMRCTGFFSWAYFSLDCAVSISVGDGISSSGPSSPQLQPSHRISLLHMTMRRGRSWEYRWTGWMLFFYSGNRPSRVCHCGKFICTTAMENSVCSLVFCPRGCSLGCTGICGRTGRQEPSSSA
jgi:hypothetical protein